MTTAILAISGISIKQDSHGRFCLNDLHKAAGGENKHRPSLWVENQQTKSLISELESEAGIPALVSLKGGKVSGTFAAKELVYAYAMWISANFHIAVIRAYDSLVNSKLHEQPAETLACLKMQRHVSEMVNAHAAKNGKHHNSVYDDIKTRFEFPRLEAMPILKYREICNYFGVKMKYDLPKTITIDVCDFKVLQKEEAKALPAPAEQKIEVIPNDSVIISRKDYDAFKKLDDIIGGIRFALKY